MREEIVDRPGGWESSHRPDPRAPRHVEGGALRVGVLSPPMLPVPPATYAGTERVVDALVDELHRRGHAVTLFAPGDSTTPAELVPTIERSLWSQDYKGNVSSFINLTLAKVWRQHE